MPRYRAAPPLIPLVDARSPLEQFHDFFLRDGRAPIVGPEDRVILFSRKVGTYHPFVKAFQSSQWGKPVQRFGWIEDTLRSPSAIWKKSGRRPEELFVSFYEANRTKTVFAIKAAICEVCPAVVLDPFDYQILRGENELERLIGGTPPCWSCPDDIRSEEPPEVTSTCWRVRMIYGPIRHRTDPPSWTRQFRQLESNHPGITIIEVSSEQPADYWVLDTNTSDRHADTGSFQAEARAAGAIPLAVNTPSNLVVKETDGRIYLFSMRMRARN